jgi:hypothetical protein
LKPKAYGGGLFRSILDILLVRLQSQTRNNTIVKLDPAFDALVSSDAKLELVKAGFGFTEGITWYSMEGVAICSSAICTPM